MNRITYTRAGSTAPVHISGAYLEDSLPLDLFSSETSGSKYDTTLMAHSRTSYLGMVMVDRLKQAVYSFWLELKT